MMVVHWTAKAGRHPVAGRSSWNIIVTDKRVLFAKTSLLGRLAKGAEIGGAMSAVTAGIAQAAAGAVIASLGSALNRGTWPDISEKRQIASAELAECDSHKDAVKTFSQIFPGRLVL